MKRDLPALTSKKYELVVVGGGIFGVCAAWDAALRGLSTVILERGDFCQATSANHFKVVHGGIRYIQHLDFYRVRESSRERNILLRIAPHLVQPLPIVIPTYGHGLTGKEILRAGFALYDIMTLDRNSGIGDPERQIPSARFLSRKKVLSLFPGLEEKGLTGGAVFCDGQMYNPTRLAISFLRSAVNAGAEAANYVSVEDLLFKENRLCGVKARDILSDSKFEVRGKMVLNTAGPWAHRILSKSLGLELNPKPVFSRDLAFVVNRPPISRYGLAFSTKTKDVDSVLDRGGRHLFALPWRGVTLIGVWHKVFERVPEEISVSETELQTFVNEVNESCPYLNLRTQDISMVNTGLTLFGDEDHQGSSQMSFGKRSRLIDHGSEHDLEGLITLIGVRATTAQGMAEKAIDLVLKRLGKHGGKSRTSVSPIYGGSISHFEKYVESASKANSSIDAGIMRCLVHNYGSQYQRVLNYIDEDPSLAEPLNGSSVIKAEVVHAVREEMAQKLSDVVFRRTDVGTAAMPGEDALTSCANLMAVEKGWKQGQIEAELAEVRKAYPPFNKKY